MGSPTSAHATRAVVLTATDASTPAEVVAATFQFPVVGSGAAITRDDWDHSGYGLSTRTTYLLALIGSQVNVGFSDATIWRRPPQSGNVTGHLLDDDGNELTDYSDLTFTEGESRYLLAAFSFGREPTAWCSTKLTQACISALMRATFSEVRRCICALGTMSR